eukprot:9141191-Pyramimonas_sp.AAC.1
MCIRDRARAIQARSQVPPHSRCAVLTPGFADAVPCKTTTDAAKAVRKVLEGKSDQHTSPLREF